MRETIISKGIGIDYRLRFEFIIETLPRGDIYLVIENPKMFRSAKVNGSPIDLLKDCSEWIDWNFRKYNITGLIKGGLNYIELEGVV